MNILFFLTPKALCSYIEAGSTLRQAMERMENSGYTALPVLDKDGSYCGVLTEGDLLWAFKRLCVMDLRQTEDHFISEILPRREIHPSASTRASKISFSSPQTRTLFPSSTTKTPSSASSPEAPSSNTVWTATSRPSASLPG